MTEEERMGIQNTIQSIQKRLDSLEERVERWENQELECEPNIAIDTPQEKPSFREVTLRIPKGMRVGDAFNLAYLFSDSSWEEFITRSDTDLQKALDEVQE